MPVSSPAASVPEARVADMVREWVGERCEVLHGSAALLATLDDKRDFSRLAASVGLTVPESALITGPGDVERFDFAPDRSYILKRLSYNPVGRTDLTRSAPRHPPEQNAVYARSLRHLAG